MKDLVKTFIESTAAVVIGFMVLAFLASPLILFAWLVWMAAS